MPYIKHCLLITLFLIPQTSGVYAADEEFQETKHTSAQRLSKNEIMGTRFQLRESLSEVEGWYAKERSTIDKIGQSSRTIDFFAISEQIEAATTREQFSKLRNEMAGFVQGCLGLEETPESLEIPERGYFSRHKIATENNKGDGCSVQ